MIAEATGFILPILHKGKETENSQCLHKAHQQFRWAAVTVLPFIRDSPAKAIAGTGGEGLIGTVPAAFPGQESKSGGTHGVYHCLPVDHFPQGEFLRRHKARGAVHPPHGVDKRPGTVLVQIAEQGAV